MAPSSHAGRSLVEFLVTLLIGLAPVACGLVVLSLQVERKQEETIEVTAREAIYAIDRVLDTLHQSSSVALSLAARSCDTALADLRRQVVMQPSVRSLVLVKGNRAFCSTLYGTFDRLIDPGTFLNQRLRVDPGNDATPDAAVLLYRLQDYPYGVLAVADINVLQNELLGFQNTVVLSLQFGQQYVWSTGNGESARVPNHEEDKMRLTSELFGYTVHAGYPDGHTWLMIRQAALATLPSLLLVGILTATVAYWGLYRRNRRSP
ncbi:CSS-motif domain-containing protein [Pseudomonas sp. BJa5]|uniref:CSS-motif domain-containing protein n=1 Tax=Pseudomonas sp. BJa5 TaxID=2936270 RepID=UPI002559EF61|nr:CSS-motif domain-containing protein [Pseudomonas sp. BGr12]MDL2422614.1 CSS-motif domain-containing protein [Pseudomonas sp. BGr12]